MDVCLLWKSCVIRKSFVRRADHPSRRVLPSVVCLSDWAWSWSLENEEALAHRGSRAMKKHPWSILHPPAPILLTKLRLCVYVCCNHNSSGNKKRILKFWQLRFDDFWIFPAKVIKIGTTKGSAHGKVSGPPQSENLCCSWGSSLPWFLFCVL